MVKDQKGFSLIELMIVVAIIGVLAAIAVPNYQRFVRKSKQSEAKSLLTSYYTAAKATMAEHGYHIGNFPVIGYQPEGNITYRIQSLDSGQPVYPGIDATTDDAGCVATNSACGGVGAAYITWTENAVSAQNHTNAPLAGQDTFTARSAADIGGNQNDEWSIDNVKTLVNNQDGTL